MNHDDITVLCIERLKKAKRFTDHIFKNEDVVIKIEKKCGE